MPYFGIFYTDFIIVSRILQVNSRSSHTRKFYLPHENRETSPPFLCTTHEASSPVHTKCVPSRARSAIHRAGVLLRSVARRTRDHAKRVSSRARSAVHRAGVLLRSAVRRTREHAKRVSSRRMHSPFYTRAGRERARPPFRARSAIRRAGHLLRSVRMVDAGGGFCRSAALRLPSVLTFTHPRHRHEISLPRTRSVIHHTMGFHRSAVR